MKRENRKMLKNLLTNFLSATQKSQFCDISTLTIERNYPPRPAKRKPLRSNEKYNQASAELVYVLVQGFTHSCPFFFAFMVHGVLL